MSAIFKRGRAQINANLTPMIDVTFLLIVFFVLVSQIVEVENVPMDLPIPDDPATELAGEEQRAVINIIPGQGGRAGGYRLGTRSFPAGDQGLTGLRERLTAMFSSNPQLAVNLRADRSAHYQYVERVMRTITEAAGEVPGVAISPRVNLVVVREE